MSVNIDFSSYSVNMFAIIAVTAENIVSPRRSNSFTSVYIFYDL